MTRESRGTGEQMSRGAGEQKFLRSLTPLLPSSLFPLLLAWCGALTLAVYGRSLALPFFFDDLVLLPYVAETPLRQLWLEPAVFPYFRPLPPTFWRLSYVLWGAHQPVWLHGWNLLLQALNAWLVGYLAVRLLGQGAALPGKSWLLAGSSATFYLLFPFHFQATPWITAVYHLWVTTFILASVAAYERYCFTNQWRWAAAGSLLALAALLTQENGVLIAPLILVLALLSGGGWRGWWRTWPWLLPLLIWLPLWLAVPRTTSELGLNNLETIAQNGAWLLQGMAFPLTWLGGWLRDAGGWNDLGTAVALSFLALAVVAFVQWRLRRPPNALAWYPWAWSLLTGLPALLLLPFAYLLSSPRLLTLTAVGAAWLWAEALTLVAAWGWQATAARRATAVALTVGLAALGLLPGWRFLDRQMTFHALLGDLYQQLTAVTVAANADGRTAVAINFPSEIGVSRPTFALGHEGIVFVVVYVPVSNIVSVQTGRSAQLAMLRYEDTRPTLPYRADVLGGGQNWPDLIAQPGALAVFDTDYGEAAISLKPAGAWADIAVVEPALGLSRQKGLRRWCYGMGEQRPLPIPCA
jgi:hypothetical protein